MGAPTAARTWSTATAPRSCMFNGLADCSDEPGCRLPAALHLFMISCAEVDCDCLADTVPAAAQARAS